MKTTFDKKYIIDNKGCYGLNLVEKLSFINNPLITIEEIVNSEMPTRDKYWWIVKKCDLTIRQKQDLAISCAEIALVIYEKKYPENKSPINAIQSAKDYLDGKITIDELREKLAAADTAAAAAYAAAATAYTDDAAAAYTAADVAADTAAAAAYAAAAAAYTDDAAAAAYTAAAAAYADADALKELLLDNLKNFIKNKY